MESILLPLHFLILGFTAWNIIKADHMGLGWIQGTTPILDSTKVKKYHHRVLIGLCLMILTGFFMFWPMKDYLLTRPQFIVKMVFVFALVINSFFIGKLQETSSAKKYSSLSQKEKIPFFISGAISSACWVLAVATAFFILP